MQEKVLFFTADDFPVYDGHVLNLWHNKDGKAKAVKSDQVEIPKEDLFFIQGEAVKFDITKASIGDFLQWNRDLEYDLGNAKIKFKKDSDVLFVGAEPTHYVVVDVDTKRNINLTRADARLNLQKKRV